MKGTCPQATKIWMFATSTELLTKNVSHLQAFTAAFGAVKAPTNFFAGTLSDRYGRNPVLDAGWLIGLPVPLLLI